MISKDEQNLDRIETLDAIRQSEEDIKAGRTRPVKEFLQELEQLLLEGLNSGEASPMTDQDWNDIRAEVKRRANARQERVTDYER